LVHQSGLIYYPEQLKPSIITYNDEDLNWWGVIANPSMLDRVKSVRYDAMVDLNQEFHPAMAMMILELEIPIKIGFQSDLADKLYSLIIQRADSGFFENNYHTIEQILGLS
jgi:ADP-heptose:LPS heptosyltransferase